MNRWQRDVRAFHRRLGFPAPPHLTLLSKDQREVRMRLVREESMELLQAISTGDPVSIAGECADLVYVAVGTAVSMGVDLAPHFRAVHAANMRKVPAPDGGKARKPDGWRSPDHYEVLGRQVEGGWWGRLLSKVGRLWALREPLS